MALGTIGQLKEQASVRRFQMDDVAFTFVTDGAMSMAPQMFLPVIPPAYWDEHPDQRLGGTHVATAAHEGAPSTTAKCLADVGAHYQPSAHTTET
jgi:hypothetical protein